MESLREERPTNELLAELSKEVRGLIEQEVALAKTEIAQHAAKARKGAIAVAIGGVLAVLGALTLVATFIISLAIALPWWLSAAIISVLLLVSGGVFAMIGVRRLKTADFVPHETIGTVKENLRWLKKQIA